MITIDLLKNHPNTITRCAEIWHEVLGKIWDPEVSMERMIQKFSEHLNKDTLPLTLVAFDADKPIGMCSLRENDCIRPDFIYAHLSPETLAKIAWLGSLVVDSEHQKKGLGKILIDATKNKARELGFSKLYLCTFDPTIPYYVRLGWTVIGMGDEFKGHPVTVMETVI